MSDAPPSGLTRVARVAAIVAGLVVVLCCGGLLRRCGQISVADGHAKAAVPLLSALSVQEYGSPEELREAVRRAGEEWAATLGDDDYEVLLARRGEPFQQVLSRNFRPDESRDLAIARPYGRDGQPTIPGRCGHDGRPISHVNVEVRVGDESWVVHFTNFHR